MERKDHVKEALPCHLQAASLGPGARMLAWTARAPQKSPRLGPGLCTTTVSFRAVCSKLAFLRPRIAARHLEQVPQDSTKGSPRDREGPSVQLFPSVCSGWFLPQALKAKPEGLRQAGIVSRTSGQGAPPCPTLPHPAPWKSTISFAYSVELKLLERCLRRCYGGS